MRGSGHIGHHFTCRKDRQAIYIWKVNNCYDLRWEEEDEEEEVIWRLPSWGMRSGHGHRSPSKPCSQIQPLQQEPPARPPCTTSPTATWPSPSFWRLHPQPPLHPCNVKFRGGRGAGSCVCLRGPGLSTVDDGLSRSRTGGQTRHRDASVRPAGQTDQDQELLRFHITTD